MDHFIAVVDSWEDDGIRIRDVEKGGAGDAGNMKVLRVSKMETNKAITGCPPLITISLKQHLDQGGSNWGSESKGI